MVRNNRCPWGTTEGPAVDMVLAMGRGLSVVDLGRVLGTEVECEVWRMTMRRRQSMVLGNTML